MNNICNLKFHHGGSWVYNIHLEYQNDEADVITNSDVDFLDYESIKKYEIDLKLQNIRNVFCATAWKGG
ncbi:unnamed protein product [Cuscuta epithymum]|uniref:PB1-like domain-containing protein n=1 Tax=Cuscuta epithymum TaxID=186058 RepID=A0AAV0CB59_9ASTE|nr:unnamed protein product [Cuscuta epithymum]